MCCWSIRVNVQQNGSLRNQLPINWWRWRRTPPQTQSWTNCLYFLRSKPMVELVNAASSLVLDFAPELCQQTRRQKMESGRSRERLFALEGTCMNACTRLCFSAKWHWHLNHRTHSHEVAGWATQKCLSCWWSQKEKTRPLFSWCCFSLRFQNENCHIFCYFACARRPAPCLLHSTTLSSLALRFFAFCF